MVPCSFESLGHYYILHRCPSNPLSIYISIDNIVVWRYWYRFVAKSCPTLSDPMDCSLPGYSVHGISQARILEWVSISFSRGSSQPRDQTCISCLVGGFFTTELPGKPTFHMSRFYSHLGKYQATWASPASPSSFGALGGWGLSIWGLHPEL